MAKKLEVQFAVIDKATSELNRISREFNGVSERINKFGMAARNIFAGAATIGAVEGLRRMAAAGVEYGGKIDDLAKRTGLAREEIQKLDYFAGQSGASLDTVVRGVQKLRVSSSEAQSGNQKMAETFRLLGVNLKDDSHLLENTLIAISKIENPTQRAAAAQKVFGKAAGEMLQIVGGGEEEIRKLADSYAKLGGALTDEQIKILDDAGDKIKQVEFQSKRLSATLTSVLAPAISFTFEALSNALSGLTKSADDKKLDLFNQSIARSTDEINKLKLALMDWDDPGKKKNFLQKLWGNDYREGLARAYEVQSRQLEMLKAERDKLLASKPAAATPKVKPTGDGGFGGGDGKKERVQSWAEFQQEEEKFRIEAEAKTRAALKEQEKKAFDEKTAEIERENKIIAEKQQRRIERYIRAERRQLEEEKRIAEEKKAIEAAKSDFARDVTLSGIQQLGTMTNAIIENSETQKLQELEKMKLMATNENDRKKYTEEATRVMAENAKKRKVISLMETVAYGGVSSALAWKEAFSSAPGEFYSKLAAAIIGTGAAVANTAVALATINRYATGTRSAAGGLALVGEQGPELVRMPAGASVMTAGETRNVYHNSNSQTVINVHSGGVVESFKAAIRSGAADRAISDMFARARGMRLMPA